MWVARISIAMDGQKVEGTAKFLNAKPNLVHGQPRFQNQLFVLDQNRIVLLRIESRRELFGRDVQIEREMDEAKKLLHQTASAQKQRAILEEV